MRDLKFRGICLASGNMVFGGGIDTQRDTPKIINQGVNYFVDAKTVGQFTGAFDTGSRELYVDDLVQVEGLGLCVVSLCHYYGVTFIDNEGQETPMVDCMAENDSFTLVGNIHQNKDLLND